MCDDAHVPGPSSASGLSLLSRTKLRWVDLDTFNDLAISLAGVRRTSAGGLARWQYEGRLVARELDSTHVAVRDGVRRTQRTASPAPTGVLGPARFATHMMVVVHLDAGDDGAVEVALEYERGACASFILLGEADAGAQSR